MNIIIRSFIQNQAYLQDFSSSYELSTCLLVIWGYKSLWVLLWQIIWNHITHTKYGVLF